MAMRRLIDEAAAHIAAISGASADVIWTGISSAVINDSGVCGEIGRSAKALGLDVTDARPLSLAGDNIAEYLNEAPGCYAYLGTSNASMPDTMAGIHNGHFDIDEAALPLGAALYAAAALRFLGVL